MAARRRDYRLHRLRMTAAYLGTCIAFGFTLLPNRLIGQWVRGLLFH
jgi:uncharacterized membrane protein